MLISFMFFILASACNAIMDKITHHYHLSIFRDLNNEKWWNAEISWRNKYVDGDPSKGRVKWFWGINKPVQITDAWHFFKMLMIVFLCSSIGIAFVSSIAYKNFLWFIGIVTLYGASHNLIFSFLYNKIFEK